MTSTSKLIVKSFVADATRADGTGYLFTGSIDGVTANAWCNSTTLRTIIGKTLLSTLGGKFSETLITQLTSGIVLDVEYKEEGSDQLDRNGNVVATIKNSHYSVALKGAEVAINDCVTIATDLLHNRMNKLPMEQRRGQSLLSLMRDATFKTDFATAADIFDVPKSSLSRTITELLEGHYKSDKLLTFDVEGDNGGDDTLTELFKTATTTLAGNPTALAELRSIKQSALTGVIESDEAITKVEELLATVEVTL